MKNNIKLKKGIFALTILLVFTVPATVSAQSFWDYLSFDFWISSSFEDKGDPNDDKKKKPGLPQPVEPKQEPAPEQCFEGVIPVPCPDRPIDNKLK